MISREVKANYRTFKENDTGRLAKTGENIRDICRLYDLFDSRYPDFSMAFARQKAADQAWNQYRKFSALGDADAAAANQKLWLELTPFRRRLIKAIKAAPFVRKTLSIESLDIERY